jgi:prepilin-type N-terminal cleavage/methylation domain-containing protein
MRSALPTCVRDFTGSEKGFSLLELLVVVAIMATCLAITIALNPQIIRTARADSGLVQALEVIRSARETAISQRRNIRVVFTLPNTIQTVREDLGAGGVVVGTTPLSTVRLENGLVFALVAGVPDTPDQFGRITWDSFSSATRMFTSEGSFIDNQGNPMNGTLFLSVPDQANSARAITFFGPTALLRAWRWDGRRWVE